VGQNTTEPWDVWYPKARAAYSKVGPNSTPSDIADFYKDVTPVPDYVTYVAEEVGQLDQSDTRGEFAFYAESIRQFKNEFGDSDSYLAVLDQGEPVFLVCRGNLDDDHGNIVISSISKSTMGKTSTYRRTSVFQIYDRRSYGQWLRSQLLSCFTREVFSDLFLLLLLPILLPFIIIYQSLDKLKAKWGWIKDGKKNIEKALSESSNHTFSDFIRSAERMTAVAFSNAITGSGRLRGSRGSQIDTSQLTGQGMPPRAEEN